MQAPPTSCVQEVVDLPIEPLWALFRDFCGWHKWSALIPSSENVNGKEGVGSIRKFVSVSKITYVEELKVLNDAEHHMSFDVISVEPAVPGVTNIRVDVKMESLGTEQTRVTYSGWISTSLDEAASAALFEKIKPFQEAAFQKGIQSAVEHVKANKTQ